MLAIALAFVFGYSFTIVPVLRTDLALSAALSVALALAVAFVVTVPVNRALIRRGKATRWCTSTTTRTPTHPPA